MARYFDGFCENSFKIGMIDAFCEVVMQEVKGLALSPVMTEEEWEIVRPASDKIVSGFRIKSRLERSLVHSDLAPDEALEGKVVVLYYKDDAVFRRYQKLKERVADLEEQGVYDEAARREASIELRRILSYSERMIEETYGVGEL